MAGSRSYCCHIILCLSSLPQLSSLHSIYSAESRRFLHGIISKGTRTANKHESTVSISASNTPPVSSSRPVSPLRSEVPPPSMALAQQHPPTATPSTPSSTHQTKNVSSPHPPTHPPTRPPPSRPTLDASSSKALANREKMKMHDQLHDCVQNS